MTRLIGTKLLTRLSDFGIRTNGVCCSRTSLRRSIRTMAHVPYRQSNLTVPWTKCGRLNRHLTVTSNSRLAHCVHLWFTLYSYAADATILLGILQIRVGREHIRSCFSKRYIAAAWLVFLSTPHAPASIAWTPTRRINVKGKINGRDRLDIVYRNLLDAGQETAMLLSSVMPPQRKSSNY